MYEGVKRLANEMVEPERDHWLQVIRACYEVAEKTGGEEFAKRWVQGLRDAPISLRKLRRYGILQQVGSAKRGHRAYWRMADREGVRAALKELGYL